MTPVRYIKDRRDRLVEAGYIPLPIRPGSKSPVSKGWALPDYTPPQKGDASKGIGIVCGRGAFPIAAIDIDITDEEIAAAMRNKVRTLFGQEPVYRVGRSPKCLIVCRHESEGIPKRSSTRYTCGAIEILGAGQQFVAFGKHPDTKREYYWPDKSIFDVRAEALPVVTAAQIQELFSLYEWMAEQRGFALVSKSKKDLPAKRDDYDPDDPLDRPPKVDKTYEELGEMLKEMDPDCGRSLWLRTGMALHHQTDGGPEGLRLWDEWSAKGKKYKPNECANFYGGFGRNRQRPVTAASLIKAARIAKEEKEAKATASEEELKTAVDLFDIDKWKTGRFTGEPEPLPMVIDGVLQRGIVAAMYSAGGAGKSTVALNMAVKIALAEKPDNPFDEGPPVTFLGQNVIGGAVVILTAEDPDIILHRRFNETVKAVAGELGMLPEEALARVQKNLYIASTFGHSVQLFRIKAVDQTLAVTQYYESFLETLQQIKDLQLVVIDTKVRYSPAEGMGNVTVTQEITHYERMAQTTGAAVLLLHHTNKVSRDGSQTGAQAFRDATAMFDSVRAAWYLRSCKPSELQSSGIDDYAPGKYLLLENAKNNYLPICPTVILERDGYRFTPRPYIAKAPRSDEETKERKQQAANEAVLEIMRVATNSLTQAELVRRCREADITRSVVIEAVRQLIDDGLVIINKIGKSNVHILTDEGKAPPDLSVKNEDSS